METPDTVSPMLIASDGPGVRWFCQYGCVIEQGGVSRVFVGDTLLGEFDPGDRDLGPRNVLLVILAKEPKIHLGHLAAAFGISDEHLRRLRIAANAEGFGAVLTQARGCSERDKIDPAKVRELRALFEEGWNPTDATRRQRRRGRVSRSTVSRERRRWLAEQAAARGSDVATRPVPTATQQVRLADTATGRRHEGDDPSSTVGSANPGTAADIHALELDTTSSCSVTRDAIADRPSAKDGVKGSAAPATAERSIAGLAIGDDASANAVVGELADSKDTAASTRTNDDMAVTEVVTERADNVAVVTVVERGVHSARDDGVTRDELAAGATVEDGNKVGAEAATAERAFGEPAVTGDDVAEEAENVVAENAGTTVRAVADDAMARNVLVVERNTADLVAEQIADCAADPEPPATGTDEALANDERERGPVPPLRSRPVASSRLVQHVGSWLLIALAQQHGLHQEAARLAGGDATRIAIDAALAALAIGERTIEGVRRLATPTAPLLLRCDHTPTANSIRRRLHVVANEHGAGLMAKVGERYLDAARAEAKEPAVFYIDNHLRAYTGQEVVRKGWRMQDKRVVPGTSDYYVHDEDGRPVFRIDTPSHDSLCQWLMPIVTRLRAGLGPEERILLVFDRAGAHPVEMATLRDAGVEFVTYERRPYPEHAPSDFERTIVVRGERYGVHEGRLKNLGKGRGRVRRIALRSTEGKQINLLAISAAPLEQLVGCLMGEPSEDTPSGRWQQENAFKHNAERWGINQLDGRKVEPYPAGTIIPNPARRRNERALKIARADEGRARCVLGAANLTDRRRARAEADLVDAIQRRVALELARPMIPKHAPIEQTELAGKLVRHPAELKSVVDTIRIVCANVEAELADLIAPMLKRPREAKTVIANVFTAPGRVDVTTSEICVRLSPAANRSEHAAIRRLLAKITARKLTLPGDARSRPLRFELHIS